MDAGTSVKFLGNLDKDMFSKLILPESATVAEAAVRLCAANYHKRLVKMLPGTSLSPFKLGPAASSVEEGLPSSSTTTMQPKVITYDARGRPVTKQDHKAADVPCEVYQWSTFMATSCNMDMLEETWMKCVILGHLHRLHAQLPHLTESDLKLSKGDTRGGGVRVVVLKDMPAGALRMAPLVTGGSVLSRLSKELTAPYVLKVKVSHAGSTVEWYLNGAGGLPPASAVAEPIENTVSQHNWMPGHNPWPLWFVKRVADAKESNCHIQDVLVRMVTTFAPPSPLEAFSDNVDITIPTLVNTSAVVKGEELKVLWIQRQKDKAQKTGQITWASQARVKIGKQQKK